MVPRFLAFGAVIVAVCDVGCGGDFSVAFEPLEAMGGSAGIGGAVMAGANASTGGNGNAGAGAGASAGASASASAGASGAGAAGGGASGGETASSGSAGAGAAGETASAGSAGAGGAGWANCQELGPWLERSYALGERVSSLCKAPYNGACPANTLHTFECQPPTGLVGLGWCTARQPGVGNGWAEAWLLKADCTY